MQCLHGTKCTTHWSQIVQGDKCYIHAALKQDWVVPSCCDAVTCIWDNWLICLVLLTDVQKWLLTHCETWTSTLQSALRTAQSLMWVRISQSTCVWRSHVVLYVCRKFIYVNRVKATQTHVWGLPYPDYRNLYVHCSLCQPFACTAPTCS